MNDDLIEQRLQTADEKLTLILTTVQSLSAHVDSIDSRLQRVEQTVDDARPVWQLVLTNVAHLQEGQRRLEDRFQHLEHRFGHLEDRFGHLEDRFGRLEQGHDSLCSELKAFRRVVDHRFLVLSGSVLARYTELEQRVTRLELNSSPPNSQT